MGITHLPNVIASEAQIPGDSASTIESLDGTTHVQVAETTLSQLRNAIRYAEQCQERLRKTSLSERITVAQLLMREYAKRRDEIVWGLGMFRGMVSKDSGWMCEVLDRWADECHDLVKIGLGVPDSSAELVVKSSSRIYGRLAWRSKGKAALFCSATMDGPAAIAAMCHAILSGTHLILRPSWRDTVTHLAFEILLKHGLGHYAQLVRWRSDSPHAATLNKQLLLQVSQALIFSSNETYQDLLGSIATPGSAEWESVLRKSRRYGTGLPLAIVTSSVNLEQAIPQIIDGARLGCGRFCLSTTPVLVDTSIYSQFKDALIRQATLLKPGSPVESSSDLGTLDPNEIPALTRAMEAYGGQIEFGDLHTKNNFVVKGDVPQDSTCLYEEFPGTLLCLIPVQSLEQAIQIGKASLHHNNRDAWTAVVTYGNSQEFEEISGELESYRHCHGGVISRVKLLLPHQGTYFLADLMRRSSIELNSIDGNNRNKGNDGNDGGDRCPKN